MNCFTALIFLCSAAIAFSSNDVNDNFISYIKQNILSYQFSCSAVCAKSFGRSVFEEIGSFVNEDQLSISALEANYAIFCALYKGGKQCLKTCPNDKVKDAATILSTPFETICSDEFKIVKKNVACLYSSAHKILPSCYKQCIAAPNFEPVEPGTLPPTETKLCEQIGCYMNCTYNGLIGEKCDLNAVNMLHKVARQWFQSVLKAFEKVEMPKDQIPDSCKRLGNGSAFKAPGFLVFVGALLLLKIFG